MAAAATVSPADAHAPARCPPLHILLTGSSGYLGRTLAPLLQREGHTVVGLDVLPGAHTSVQGSVADVELVQRLFAQNRFTGVIHAGALHKPDIDRGHSKASFISANVTGTLHLLEACAASPHSVRFVYTSTTSLMISSAVRAEEADEAVWMDESFAPLEPRNVYGVTKLAAEGLVRLFAAEGKLDGAVILRTSRFFPENDDAEPGQEHISSENLKASEFMYRRLSVEDAARAHIRALERAPAIKFDILLVSAPTPFRREDAAELKRDVAAVIRRRVPDAESAYAQAGWILPRSIGRVYDSARAQRVLDFVFDTDFSAVLRCVKDGKPLPFLPPEGTMQTEAINAQERSRQLAASQSGSLAKAPV